MAKATTKSVLERARGLVGQARTGVASVGARLSAVAASAETPTFAGAPTFGDPGVPIKTSVKGLRLSVSRALDSIGMTAQRATQGNRVAKSALDKMIGDLAASMSSAGKPVKLGTSLKEVRNLAKEAARSNLTRRQIGLSIAAGLRRSKAFELGGPVAEAVESRLKGLEKKIAESSSLSRIAKQVSTVKAPISLTKRLLTVGGGGLVGFMVLKGLLGPTLDENRKRALLEKAKREGTIGNPRLARVVDFLAATGRQRELGPTLLGLPGQGEIPQRTGAIPSDVVLR